MFSRRPTVVAILPDSSKQSTPQSTPIVSLLRPDQMREEGHRQAPAPLTVVFHANPLRFGHFDHVRDLAVLERLRGRYAELVEDDGGGGRGSSRLGLLLIELDCRIAALQSEGVAR